VLKSRKSFLISLFSVALVFLLPTCLKGLEPDAHEATTTEMSGLKSAPLSPDAQERLSELEARLADAHDKRDAQAEAGILHSIGLLNYANQRFDEALDAFSKSLVLYRQLSAENLEAAELCEVGAAYTALGMDEKALDAYKEALPLWRVLDRGREAATLGKIGEVFRTLHDGGEALHFDQAALEAYKQAGDRGGEATVLNNIGLAYFVSGNERKAVGYFDKARTVYHAVANLAGEATALNNLAVADSASGDNVDALASFEQALELHRKSNDRSAEAVTLNSMGVVYSRMGQSLIANRFYSQAASIYHALGDREAEAREPNALSLAATDAKRNGHQKKTNTDEGLNAGGMNAGPSQHPIVQ
jgi:tetratricopeptide (TPR) repeat protein